MKNNYPHQEDLNIVLPIPPLDMEAEFEMEVYVRFMRCFRYVSISRQDIGVLTAIQFVSDMMDIPNTQVTKILVDLGLRAPRMAFPESYLEMMDQFTMREIHDIGYSNLALRDLRHHWQAIREGKFMSFEKPYHKHVGKSA